MELLWFGFVAFLLTGYVVLDGFDIGAGSLHLWAARTEEERATILESIGPFWDGNEVWLLAGGGTLFCAFPVLYASSFSGFYLPLMMVLWLLILRGISIEFRHQLSSRIWTPFWDFGFWLSSSLLAIFFGAALGNVVRGVPLNAEAEFFLPLWTNFQPGSDPGILDWYTVLVGLAAYAALLHHGALWLRWKTAGVVEERARDLARLAWWAVAGLTVAVTAASFSLQPLLGRSFSERPWGAIFPLIALAGLAGTRLPGSPLRAFLASGVYLAGMLLSVSFGLFPAVLPAVDPRYTLTIHNSAAGSYGLSVGVIWWIPAMLLTLGYFAFLFRRFAGKAGAGAH